MPKDKKDAVGNLGLSGYIKVYPGSRAKQVEQKSSSATSVPSGYRQGKKSSAK